VEAGVAENILDDFDGFIMPDGEMIRIQDTDRMLSIVAKLSEDRDKIVLYLWGLAQECVDRSHFKAAYAYFEKVLDLVDAPNEKADCLLKMGLAMEQVQDYQAAIEAYQGHQLPQEKNRCGFPSQQSCCNQMGDHQEAEEHCQTQFILILNGITL
jgi:tetratricopeptide (TPR) repeat protein